MRPRDAADAASTGQNIRNHSWLRCGDAQQMGVKKATPRDGLIRSHRVSSVWGVVNLNSYEASYASNDLCARCNLTQIVE